MLELNKNSNGIVNSIKPIVSDYSYINANNVEQLRTDVEDLINSKDWSDKYTDQLFSIIKDLTGLDIDSGETLEDILNKLITSFGVVTDISSRKDDVQIFDDSIDSLATRNNDDTIVDEIDTQDTEEYGTNS